MVPEAAVGLLVVRVPRCLRFFLTRHEPLRRLSEAHPGALRVSSALYLGAGTVSASALFLHEWAQRLSASAKSALVNGWSLKSPARRFGSTRILGWRDPQAHHSRIAHQSRSTTHRCTRTSTTPRTTPHVGRSPRRGQRGWPDAPRGEIELECLLSGSAPYPAPMVARTGIPSSWRVAGYPVHERTH